MNLLIFSFCLFLWLDAAGVRDLLKLHTIASKMLLSNLPELAHEHKKWAFQWSRRALHVFQSLLQKDGNQCVKCLTQEAVICFIIGLNRFLYGHFFRLDLDHLGLKVVVNSRAF